MKRGLWLLLLIGLVVVCLFGCMPEVEQPTDRQSIAAVISRPDECLTDKLTEYKGGVVVQMHKKGNKAIVVVAPLPLPDLQEKGQSAKRLLVVSIPSWQFGDLSIGSIIKATGRLKTIDLQSRTMFYVDAADVEVIDQIDIHMPDFMAITDALMPDGSGSNDDDFFLMPFMNSLNPTQDLLDDDGW